MIKLNLKTSNKSQEQIKQYLEENVSEMLADKINNGVKITKDNKVLLNKKDLDGFWKFATEEARKQAEKGANSAYVDNETVFGWAIHYFEEDSIEGNLYNEDGSEYKIEKSKPISKIETKPKKPENKQATLFDLMNNENTEKYNTESKTETSLEGNDAEEDDDEWTEEEMDEALDEIDKEIHCSSIPQEVDYELIKLLAGMLDNKMEVKL